MAGTSLGEIEALARFQASLARYVDRLLESARQALNSALGDRDHIRGRVRQWAAIEFARARDVQRLESELASCRQQENSSCSGIVQALARAKGLLQEAEERHSLCRHLSGRADAAVDRYRQHHFAFTTALPNRSSDAVAELSSLRGIARGYAASAHGEASADDQGTPSSLVASISGTGTRAIPLARIDLSDTTVTGPESYKKVPYPDMRRGLLQLDEVVLPAVVRGADAEHFSQLDRARGLDYENGYRRVYDAFFGDSAIRLDPRPDGTYTVTNGYHRIGIARELGWLTIPAQVEGRT